MKRAAFLLAVAVILNACGPGAEVVNPTRPASVHGWNAFHTGAITVKGEFVLKKGESVDNGRVAVTVADILPVKYRLMDAWEMPKARVQFFEIPSARLICESVFTRGGNSIDPNHLCGDRLEWTDIYIRDVNYAEGWVFFDLR